jgi:hypothetical protein
MLWSAASALTTGAWAVPLERVAFDSAAHRIISGGLLILADPIQGDLAKPDGASPFPVVIVLHGCAGIHATLPLMMARMPDQTAA